MKKRQKKIKDINQTSFYFEDYLQTNKKNKFSKKTNNFQDRIYLLFFFLLSLVLIFCIKIVLYSYIKIMSLIDDSKIIEEVKILFEIKAKKIDSKSKIKKYFELDSLNQLKLMGFIDENSNKKINLSKIQNIKTFKDIVKLIND